MKQTTDAYQIKEILLAILKVLHDRDDPLMDYFEYEKLVEKINSLTEE